MSEAYEKINAVLSAPDFFEKNKDLASVEEILEKVNETYPDVTKEELVSFLTEVSEVMHTQGELSEGDLDNVAGGSITFLTCCVAACVIGGTAYGCYKAGKAIGQAIYNLWG